LVVRKVETGEGGKVKEKAGDRQGDRKGITEKNCAVVVIIIIYIQPNPMQFLTAL